MRWWDVARSAVRGTWDWLSHAMSLVLVAAIRGYQRFISPAFGQTCRYYPSCSSYALASVRTHGPIKGLLLAAWRLLRCNPWSRGGIDHVPEKGSWRGGKDVRPTHERVGS
jgi:hypothetical protein